MLSALFIVLGLCLFEIISSIDNVVVNASFLYKMSPKARHWFLIWGVLVAVFVVRGVLPWLILYLIYPQAGLWGSLVSVFMGNPHMQQAIELASPRLFLSGGVFLFLLFLHWLLLEDKNDILHIEKHIQRQGVWFFAVASILLCVLVWFALQIDPFLAFAAVIGSSAYFIIHGFREQAEKNEASVMGETKSSEISKLLYLIIIDATFSLDSVLGAFAFTLSVPLILIGNGVGAFVIAWLSVNKADKLKEYKHLKDGAMYSVGILGCFMIVDGFGAKLPEWLSPVVTICIISYFLWLSIKSKSLVSNPQEKI